MQKIILVLSTVLLMCGISFSVDLDKCTKQTFVISAYYSPLPDQDFYYKGTFEAEKKLNGEGTLGASGKKVFNGMLAAPKSYEFGTQIYFPGFGVGQIEDRGGAIVEKGIRGYDYDRIDIWMGFGEEGLKRALSFGKQTINGYICDEKLTAGFDFSNIPTYKGIIPSSLWSVSISLGTKNDFVKQLQGYLVNLGYLEEENQTGYFGSKTQLALIKYQLEKGIVKKGDLASGYFGPKTKQTLKSDLIDKGILASSTSKSKTKIVAKTESNTMLFSKGFLIGEEHQEVKLLQKHLKILGYYNGTENGVYDKQTANSVYKFQVEKEILKGDEDSALMGYFGPKTRLALTKEISDFDKKSKLTYNTNDKKS